MRKLLLVFVFCAASVLAQNAIPAAQTPLAIVLESIKRADKDINVRKNYTYQQREVEKELDGKGAVKKTEIHTYDVVMIGRKQHEKLIAKDDKPLTEKEAAKEEERMRKDEEREEKRTDRSDEQKAKDKEKEDERDRKFIKEFSEVYAFTFAGEETIDGEPTWIIEAEPIASYQPHSLEARLLKCLHGRIWIAKRDYQWVKVDGEAIHDFGFGLFLFKLHKGTHIYMEQTRVNNEIWLPKLIKANLGARIAWHAARIDSETTYSNYKKFGSETKITGVAPVGPQ